VHFPNILVTVGLGHGVYRKLYTLIGGQRAEKFENHWSSHSNINSGYSLHSMKKIHELLMTKRLP